MFCFSEKPFSVFCGADEPNKKLTHSSTNLHTAHLGKKRENAKTSGPTELQWQNIKEKQGECLCGTSELGGFRKEKA